MKIKTLEEVRERVERALKRVYPDSAVDMMIDIDDLYAINDAIAMLKKQKAEQPKIVRCKEYGAHDSMNLEEPYKPTSEDWDDFAEFQAERHPMFEDFKPDQYDF